jgi:hypothetical protein
LQIRSIDSCSDVLIISSAPERSTSFSSDTADSICTCSAQSSSEPKVKKKILLNTIRTEEGI